MQIDAEERIASIPIDAAAAILERVPDLEPPFVRLEGRVVPECSSLCWIADFSRERPT